MPYDPSLIVTALDSEASNSSANSNTVGKLDTPFTADPPTLADMETLLAKINELITGLRR